MWNNTGLVGMKGMGPAYFFEDRALRSRARQHAEGGLIPHSHQGPSLVAGHMQSMLRTARLASFPSSHAVGL